MLAEGSTGQSCAWGAAPSPPATRGSALPCPQPLAAGTAEKSSCDLLPTAVRRQHLLSWRRGVTPAEPPFWVPICEPCAGCVRSLGRRVTPRSPCWEGDDLH